MKNKLTKKIKYFNQELFPVEDGMEPILEF